LPWHELSDDQHILLLIPKAVQEEIDRQKHDGNSRRSKRAKKANALLREIILSEHTKIIIKESNPLVEISFTPALKLECHLPDFLDMSHPDDRIIAEILNYKSIYHKQSISIITHDTNPLLTAKRCNIQSIVVPDEWLLPPEPDQKDKIINKLTEQINDLTSCYPVISIIVEDTIGNEIDKYETNILIYNKLTDQEVQEFVDKIKERYPPKTDFSNESSPPDDVFSGLRAMSMALGYTQTYVPPSKEEINTYLKVDYPNWIDKVSEFISEYPELLENESRFVKLLFVISNIGNVPAENLIITFEALGGIFFYKFDEKDQKEKNTHKIPSPPQPPEGRWEKQRNSFLGLVEDIQKSHLSLSDPLYQNIPNLSLRNDRDRNLFYWKNNKPNKPSRRWEFECEEFRHQTHNETFELNILIPPSDNQISKCAIKCTVSAKNIPSPVEYNLPLNLNYLAADPKAEIAKKMNIY